MATSIATLSASKTTITNPTLGQNNAGLPTTNFALFGRNYAALLITYTGPALPWSLTISPSWASSLSVPLETGWGQSGTLTTNSPYLLTHYDSGLATNLNWFQTSQLIVATPSNYYVLAAATCTLTLTYFDPVANATSTTASVAVSG